MKWIRVVVWLFLAGGAGAASMPTAETAGGLRPPAAPLLGGTLRLTAPLPPPAVLDTVSAPLVDQPLLQAFLSRVSIKEGGDGAHGRLINRAFERMLASPTAQELMRQFLDEKVEASVEFIPVTASRIQVEDGRRQFTGPRGFVLWKNGRLLVQLNHGFVAADPYFHEQQLPTTLAHELLGHGLGYSRAEGAGLLDAFQHHELNEVGAHLIEWLVDFELDRRFEGVGAWNYLQDAAAYLSQMKLRIRHYAVTFSSTELLDPPSTLEKRLVKAQEKRVQLEHKLKNHLSWNPVIEHFAHQHNIPDSRWTALHVYMADTAQNYFDDMATVDELTREIENNIAYFKTEEGRAFEMSLRAAASHPFFRALQTATDALARKLALLVQDGDVAPQALPDDSRLRADHWRGQITFERLIEMYEKDRLKHPEHWQR